MNVYELKLHDKFNKRKIHYEQNIMYKETNDFTKSTKHIKILTNKQT